MGVVGMVEVAVGVAILTRWTRVCAYLACAWLVGIAANLVLADMYDVAVRDVAMAVGAFTLARLEEVRQDASVRGRASAPQRVAWRRLDRHTFGWARCGPTRRRSPRRLQA